MDVAAYLKEMLYREQFVFVPGLGTFLTRKNFGNYNQQQQRFYPPKNSIDFIAEEKDDAKLENYIAQQKNISLQAARYFIGKFVDEVKNDAADKNLPVKEVLFPSEEKVNAENVINTPFNQQNFGLPPLNLSAIKKDVPKLTKQEETVTNEDYVQKFYNEFSQNNLADAAEIKPKRSTSFWVTIILLLAVCILGCYTLYFYYPEMFRQFIPNKQQTVTVLPKPVDTRQKQNPIVENKPLKDTGLKKTTADTNTTSSALKPTIIPVSKVAETDSASVINDPDLVKKSPYEIIGAAFKTLKGAKKFLNQLKEKGMHARILADTHGKSTLITFGSFTNKEDAQAALAKLRAKDVNSEAYIQHYLK